MGPKNKKRGKKKPVTRLKKGEHTRYLGAWLAEGIDDKEQIKRLEAHQDQNGSCYMK